MGRITFLSILGIFIFTANAMAQSVPTAPDPIQNLAAEGAQLRYLGNEHGLDAWIAVKNGQEQYFYVQPSGEAFVMGILFDKSGDLVTVDQVQRLQAQGDESLEELTGSFPEAPAQSMEFQSPSAQMFADIEGANWVALGGNDAPVIYSFIDPQCPHCHDFIEDIRGEIESGAVQLRMIPVGLRPETKAQAAFLMAAPNAQERWFKHMDGDESALPVKDTISQQGAERNMAIMQSWKFNVTPMIIYRAQDGTVKIVRGRPADSAAILADLAG